MREMSLLIVRSRKVLIGLAFVGVLVSSGGFLGAIVGVVLALLARSVLSIDAGTGEFIAAWVMAGCLAALLLGMYMLMRERGYRFGRADVTSVGAVASAAAHASDGK